MTISDELRQRLQATARQRNITDEELLSQMLALLEAQQAATTKDIQVPQSAFLVITTNYGQIINTDDTFQALFGNAHANLMDYIHEEDRDSVRLVLIHSQDHPVSQWTCRMATQDQKAQWVQWQLNHDNENELWYCVGTQISIEAAHVQQIHFQSILESITDAFIALDTEDRFIYMNNEAEKLLQCDRAEIIGKVIWKNFESMEDSEIKRQYQKALTTNQSATFVDYYRPLSTWFEIRIYPSPVGMSVYFRDISEQRQLELAISGLINSLEYRVDERTQELTYMMQKQQRFVQILELTSDLVAIHNANGDFIYINHAGRDLLALKPEDDIKEYSPFHFYDEDSITLLIEEAIPTVIREGIWQGVTTIITFKDEQHIMSQVTMLHKEENRNIYSTVARDITAQKKTEDELRSLLQKQQELAELKSRITTMVSHEFRTPLATIRSSTDLLKRYRDRMSVERQNDYIDKIQSQITHLAMLMDSVVTINRNESVGISFNPAPLKLGEICREIISDLQVLYRDSHLISFSTIGETTAYLWDERLIRQMVINLLSNAVKYSPHQTTVNVTLAYTDGNAVLTVADNGIGIPPEDVDQLFESFYRGSNVGNIQGTGLGMALIKQTIEAHDGDIQFESTLNEGTTFTVILPLRNDV